jgi:hypothetical protein
MPILPPALALRPLPRSFCPLRPGSYAARGGEVPPPVFVGSYGWCAALCARRSRLVTASFALPRRGARRGRRKEGKNRRAAHNKSSIESRPAAIARGRGHGRPECPALAISVRVTPHPPGGQMSPGRVSPAPGAPEEDRGSTRPGTSHPTSRRAPRLSTPDRAHAAAAPRPHTPDVFVLRPCSSDGWFSCRVPTRSALGEPGRRRVVVVGPGCFEAGTATVAGTASSTPSVCISGSSCYGRDGGNQGCA